MARKTLSAGSCGLTCRPWVWRFVVHIPCGMSPRCGSARRRATARGMVSAGRPGDSGRGAVAGRRTNGRVASAPRGVATRPPEPRPKGGRSDALLVLVRPLQLHGVLADLLGLPGADV